MPTFELRALWSGTFLCPSACVGSITGCEMGIAQGRSSLNFQFSIQNQCSRWHSSHNSPFNMLPLYFVAVRVLGDTWDNRAGASASRVHPAAPRSEGAGSGPARVTRVRRSPFIAKQVQSGAAGLRPGWGVRLWVRVGINRARGGA